MANIKAFTAVLSASALLVASPAFALTVSTGVNGNTNVTVGTGVNVNIGLPAQAGASTNSSSSAQSSGGSGASTNTNSNTNVSSNSNANDGSANASGSTDLSIPLVITRTDVGTEVQASDVSASNVQTKDDLSGYIAMRMQDDVNLAAVDTASDHVAVTYPERGELLGFIPVSLETTATTDAAGDVSISEPWWGFLTASDSATLQSNVQTGVNDVLGANASSNTQLSASQQAQLIAAIEEAMAMSANASASTSGSVSTQ